MDERRVIYYFSSKMWRNHVPHGLRGSQPCIPQSKIFLACLYKLNLGTLGPKSNPKNRIPSRWLSKKVYFFVTHGVSAEGRFTAEQFEEENSDRPKISRIPMGPLHQQFGRQISWINVKVSIKIKLKYVEIFIRLNIKFYRFKATMHLKFYDSITI